MNFRSYPLELRGGFFGKDFLNDLYYAIVMVLQFMEMEGDL